MQTLKNHEVFGWWFFFFKTFLSLSPTKSKILQIFLICSGFIPPLQFSTRSGKHMYAVEDFCKTVAGDASVMTSGNAIATWFLVHMLRVDPGEPRFW